MTPHTSQNDALASIAALVVVMAAIAALTARFGISYIVAIVCALVAMLGTWRFLAASESSGDDAAIDARGERSDPAFIRLPDDGVAADVAAPVGTTGGLVGESSLSQSMPRPSAAPQAMPQEPPGSAEHTAPSAAGVDDSLAPPVFKPLTGATADGVDEIGWLGDGSPNSLGGAGRLPDGAQALSIEAPEEWPANVSGTFSLGRFEVRGASRRGTDHEMLEEFRQDDFVVARAGSDKFLLVVVANGVRTAPNAHLGSFWATRLLARNIELHLRDGVPGIEKMLDRTRVDLQTSFGERFDHTTKLRTIATRLVGLIIPVDGGPAAGFRVGDGEILMHGPLGWSSVFGAAPPDEANMVFPRVSKAEVVSIDFAHGPVLVAGDGVHTAILESEAVGAAFAAACQHPPTEEVFDQVVDFSLDSARYDRTAVGVWTVA